MDRAPWLKAGRKFVFLNEAGEICEVFVGIQHLNPQSGQLQTVVLICSAVLQRCPAVWSLLCVFRIRTALLWLLLVSHIITSALV